MDAARESSSAGSRLHLPFYFSLAPVCTICKNRLLKGEEGKKQKTSTRGALLQACSRGCSFYFATAECCTFPRDLNAKTVNLFAPSETPLLLLVLRPGFARRGIWNFARRSTRAYKGNGGRPRGNSPRCRVAFCKNINKCKQRQGEGRM